MRKKDKGTVDDAQEFSGLPAATSAITPADIQQKEFHVSRFGGYRMRDVDEYLDQVTEAMTKLTEDNQRLRSSGGMASAPSVGAPDLADTSRQADEVIARARAEAATIVQQAREQVVAGSVAGGADAGRAAVAPFLAQERDFLQQLATLVQGHAESVKGMAKAGRTQKPVVATPPAPIAAEVSSEAPSAPAKAPVADEAEEAEPPAAPEVETAPTPAPTQPPQATQPIRVQEPATASVAAGEAGDDEGGSAEGDRSLRELFWGEE
jgi:DivIVA domain-containing protein